MIQENPKVTVIIPIFNGAKYISQCIESILFQTYKSIEIIVVNDGSTDESESIIKLYPVNLINQKNAGVSVARNIGLKSAKGEYIHFLDVDDWITIDFYEKMVSAIQLTDSDIACCNVDNYISRRSTNLKHSVLISETEDKFKITNVARYGYVWRYIFKKSFLIENNILFKEGQLGEDTPFSMVAILKANRLITVPDAIYYYKKRENSICNTSDDNLKQIRHIGWKNVKEFRLKFALEHNISLPGVRTGKFSRYFDKWFS